MLTPAFCRLVRMIASSWMKRRCFPVVRKFHGPWRWTNHAVEVVAVRVMFAEVPVSFRRTDYRSRSARFFAAALSRSVADFARFLPVRRR